MAYIENLLSDFTAGDGVVVTALGVFCLTRPYTFDVSEYPGPQDYVEDYDDGNIAEDEDYGEYVSRQNEALRNAEKAMRDYLKIPIRLRSTSTGRYPNDGTTYCLVEAA